MVRTLAWKAKDSRFKNIKNNKKGIYTQTEVIRFM